MTNQITRYGTSGMHREDGVFVLYGEYERVAAECERLRAALNTPQLTATYAPYITGIVGAEGASHEVAADVFMNSMQPLTVYYGEKRIYTCMAEFCAAHPREPK